MLDTLYHLIVLLRPEAWMSRVSFVIVYKWIDLRVFDLFCSVYSSIVEPFKVLQSSARLLLFCVLWMRSKLHTEWSIFCNVMPHDSDAKRLTSSPPEFTLWSSWQGSRMSGCTWFEVPRRTSMLRRQNLADLYGYSSRIRKRPRHVLLACLTTELPVTTERQNFRSSTISRPREYLRILHYGQRKTSNRRGKGENEVILRSK